MSANIRIFQKVFYQVPQNNNFTSTLQFWIRFICKFGYFWKKCKQNNKLYSGNIGKQEKSYFDRIQTRTTCWRFTAVWSAVHCPSKNREVSLSLNERKEEIVQVKVKMCLWKLLKNVQKLDLISSCSPEFGCCHEPIRLSIRFVQVANRGCKKSEMNYSLVIQLYLFIRESKNFEGYWL